MEQTTSSQHEADAMVLIYCAQELLAMLEERR